MKQVIHKNYLLNVKKVYWVLWKLLVSLSFFRNVISVRMKNCNRSSAILLLKWKLGSFSNELKRHFIQYLLESSHKLFQKLFPHHDYLAKTERSKNKNRNLHLNAWILYNIPFGIQYYSWLQLNFSLHVVEYCKADRCTQVSTNCVQLIN